MKCLVTGGAGFIGSHIVEALLERNASVRVIDNLSTGDRGNLSSVSQDVEFVDGDIRCPETLAAVMSGMDYVFHQAALPSVARSVADPVKTHTVNATGTLNVLVAARDAGVRRVIYAGSSSAYGNTKILPKVETMSAQPLSPYAIAKHVGGQYCKVFHQLYDLETVALRYFNVFGPRQSPGSPYAGVIPIFMEHLVAGTSPIINGDGNQSRDFTYVANVVYANLLASEAPEASGELFNVGCGERASINQLFHHLRTIMGVSIRPSYSEPRAGDVRDSQADISKAQRILGYEPKVDLIDGLRATVRWFSSHVVDAS